MFQLLPSAPAMVIKATMIAIQNRINDPFRMHLA
jgi:hypothetical protein